MNRLVFIGNGFDMAHVLKTSYMDFINWYWEQRLSALLIENTSVSKDILCELKITNAKDFWLTDLCGLSTDNICGARKKRKINTR